MKILNIVIAILLGFTLSGNAQQAKSEEIKVTLSKPGSPGVLKASSHRGSMTVEAHSGNEVIVTLITDEGDDNDGNSWGDSRNGLKKISAGAYNAEIVEENNTIRIETGSQTTTHLKVKVPKNFDVDLHTHHDGDVYVKGIDGTSEIDAHHGQVTLEDVGSSANVNTHHGEIKATFRAVDTSVPMALTTYHGDVDITLPAGSVFKTKLKTTKGDIYTDFELNMDSPVQKVNQSGSKTKIEIGGWRHGNVGSGGQEYMLSTYHGDILIRKG
ncbi:DUF4097 family beta strand repeat-containing protein [Portibacter marinus]|uniref:DUF4097 family beta strand repeat-containing protein n=1 Tax=Portibacter marinus TaxID=2898660 RepID=UPI001F2216D4|nr:DUF4097 family beta strand repeat-containing protein [Portibacter marinus]